MLSYLYL